MALQDFGQNKWFARYRPDLWRQLQAEIRNKRYAISKPFVDRIFFGVGGVNVLQKFKKPTLEDIGDGQLEAKGKEFYVFMGDSDDDKDGMKAF